MCDFVGGQQTRAGNILVRQRGSTFHAGENVYAGKDYTLHAQVDGAVKFTTKRGGRKYINIVPSGAA